MSRELKIQAARAAFGFVKSGMRLGIGTGSTADEFIRILAQNVANGLQIIGVPTSERSRALCEELGVPLTTLDDTPELDLTIDGADELDHQFRLIKGGGGALLREKIVASASAQMIVIADDTKLVKHLGAFPLPIEVNPFGLRATQIAIERIFERLGLTGPCNLRMSDRAGAKEPYLTDGGHYILDASLGKIDDPDGLAFELLNIPGVVQHGLFIGLADTAVIAGETGVKILRRN